MASEVRIAHVNAYGSCQFFQNISRSTQPGTAGVLSLYLANCFRSIDTHYVHFWRKRVSSKISKFCEL
ncbi:hypothetical protein T11_12551 [Trichinella zimbabwensis]|uniref:Uncharacterized protein n=2 Tax=Trichinella zimbabwensis TaxID=268475 RepID=A0A0V1GM98_9BILA|nr:hypothetical protein T11_3180 [Trichinella zimbabwensis]KRY99332.1 hypothetical protein T11_12551 [Trichinella zimbabwensis]